MLVRLPYAQHVTACHLCIPLWAFSSAALRFDRALLQISAAMYCVRVHMRECVCTRGSTSQTNMA